MVKEAREDVSRAGPVSFKRADADQPDQRSPQLKELAMAMGMRADEVRERTMDLVYPAGRADRPSDAYLEYREARTVFGTLVIARWLFCGIATNPEEMEWMSQGGAMAARENISIVETTRGYQHWRNVLIEVAREEAARLASPAELLEEVVLVVRRSSDASLVRVAKSYDTQLRAMNAQLQIASRFKSEFLARISHELRTPLTAILGFSEVLLEGMDGGLQPKQADDVGLIYHAGQTLLELVNEILDIARIEAGMMPLTIGAVDVAEVSIQVIDRLRPIAHTKAVALIGEVSPLAVSVMGDPARIRQVLTNLVSNAIKFTPEGSVTISARVCGSEAEIAVVDTGIGIAPDAQERIFDEFRQADETITAKYGGTGLGLSIARQLIELQGGHMGVESSPGHGARFWFTLPLATASNIAAA
ncbi:MAG: HAMP domain-containing sensor histidine kinase [Candidatus Dormiibacterota bacterium]